MAGAGAVSADLAVSAGFTEQRRRRWWSEQEAADRAANKVTAYRMATDEIAQANKDAGMFGAGYAASNFRAILVSE